MTDGRGGGVGRKREKGRGKDSEMKRGKEGVDHYRSRICRVACEEEECKAEGERVKTTSRKATTRGWGGCDDQAQKKEAIGVRDLAWPRSRGSP